jgi:hypothetical protein
LARSKDDRFEKIKSSLLNEDAVSIAAAEIDQLLNKLDLKNDDLSKIC